MNGFQVVKVVIRDVNTNAEVESGVTTIDNFEVAELDEVGVFGVSNCDTCMYFLDQLLKGD